MPPLKFVAPRLLDGPVFDTVMALGRWLNLKLFGITTAAIVGTPPALDQGATYLVQSGTVSTSIDISQFSLWIVFPKPFPNGLLSIVAQCMGATGSAHFTTRVYAADKTRFQLVSNEPNVTPSVSYIAIGW